MVSEADKQRATNLQIAGFALMAVAGNAILNVFEYDFLKYGWFGFICYAMFSGLCFCGGIICLARSIEILEERKLK